jgi:hypothetical protein
MAGEDHETSADAETLPDTPLHAYKEGREGDVEGNLDKLMSGDPEESQRTEIEAKAKALKTTSKRIRRATQAKRRARASGCV